MNIFVPHMMNLDDIIDILYIIENMRFHALIKNRSIAFVKVKPIKPEPATKDVYIKFDDIIPKIIDSLGKFFVTCSFKMIEDNKADYKDQLNFYTCNLKNDVFIKTHECGFSSISYKRYMIALKYNNTISSIVQDYKKDASLFLDMARLIADMQLDGKNSENFLDMLKSIVS